MATYPSNEDFYNAKEDLRTIDAVANGINPDTGDPIATWETRTGGVVATIPSKGDDPRVYSIAALQAVTPSVGLSMWLSLGGRSGEFVWTLGDFTTSVAADTQQGIYIASANVAVTVGCWVRQCNLGELIAEWFVDNPDEANIVTAITAACNVLPTRGGTVLFVGDYSGIAEDLYILTSKTTIRGNGWNRLVFESGYGLHMGQADSYTAGDTKSGTPVINCNLEKFVVTGVTDYSGTLTTLEYCNYPTTRDFQSSLTGTTESGTSLATAMEIRYVQWWEDYSGQYDANYRALFFNMTDTLPPYEDHYHLYGTLIGLSKHLRDGEKASCVHTFFESGRSTGASDVIFNGCHLWVFTADNVVENTYAFTTDLDGATADKSVYRGLEFQGGMIEQPQIMFDLEEAYNSAGTGKDISSINIRGTYLVGNTYNTDVCVIAYPYKALFVFDGVPASSITKMFSNVRVNFMGYNDIRDYVTFTDGSFNYFDFQGYQPVYGLRTEKKLTVTILAGETSAIITHGMAYTPSRYTAMPKRSEHAQWWFTSIGATTATINVGASVASDTTIEVEFGVGIF